MVEYAVHAPNREVLKQFIWSVRRLALRGAPVLEITMPCCGEVRRYRQEYELPMNDVQCSCGNWFIKYDEQPLRVVF